MHILQMYTEMRMRFKKKSLRTKMNTRAALWLPSIECCESTAFTVHNTLHTWRASLDFEVL